MTDHLSFEQLCDLSDAAMTAAAESSARAHLRSCEECASRLLDISALATRTTALPREVAPPADLWDDIRGKLKPRDAMGRTGAPVWRMRHLAAAGVIIAVASSAFTMLAVSEIGTGRSTQDVALTPQPRVELPAQLASAEHGYARSVEVLQRTLAMRRDSLSPSTIAIVERSLRVADSAIAEARDALARDPANRALAALFASNYERKIDLLRRATELAPRT